MLQPTANYDQAVIDDFRNKLRQHLTNPQVFYGFVDSKIAFISDNLGHYRAVKFKPFPENGKLKRDDTSNSIATYHKQVGGNTVETLLGIVIHKLATLNKEVPNEHTDKAIEFIIEAIIALDMRDKDRTARGVTGTKQI